jgi:hypothetical protein
MTACGGHDCTQRADRLRKDVQRGAAVDGITGDSNDVVAPDRSRVRMAELMNAQRQVGLQPRNRDDGDGDRVAARPTNRNGNGNGLSGGMAQRIPTGVGADW